MVVETLEFGLVGAGEGPIVPLVDVIAVEVLVG